MMTNNLLPNASLIAETGGPNVMIMDSPALLK
jgi:delta 1-pyrroline-5-carboxylate dehydrogenase